MNLPQMENVESITFSQNSAEWVAVDEDVIRFYELLGNKKTTKSESIQDYPVNADFVVTMTINDAEGITTMFVYLKQGRYYLEQPYNGIYRISEEMYDFCTGE
ncbi:MAG: DUF5301 domain-containing protein [Lachnospiraceae bacterium]|nr:DUF5301 domain-containing protein [Lachnospiraceae bacterium]